ncbi:UDP-glucose 4-epimerase [Rhodopirellula islandica]|uniref:UDP-glucose 4-epimerase n=1 Tax=Rhodopirellula islandica TaxID=595434 RepID=A0A0J1BAW7_RHOIS|nr:NAD(P)-dependent oxidoreductase [Rhodopirellula islandica]KLU03817.1 UDP-glucose 4-epimerase [Rhodopirellula islandica]
MLVAVTGATGFLGRHVVSNLLQGGHSVRGWTRKAAPPELEGVDWVRGELDDRGSVEGLVAGCDAVVHTALAREGAGFMDVPQQPLDYIQTNLMGSIALLETAAAHSVGRFVFVSSGAVHQHVVEGIALDEQHPLRPGSLYGACKASMETMVHAYGSSGRINAASLRPVAIYGVDTPLENSKWFDLMRAVARGESVPADGGGKVVHVKDVAAAIATLLETESPIAGETYNCCDRFFSEHEIASRVMEITNSKAMLTGDPKSSGREMSSAKLESLGFQFGGLSRLDETIRQLVQEL